MSGKLHSKFYHFAAFALTMTAILIFFGSIYFGMSFVLKEGLAKAPQIASQMTNDFIVKGILSAIFAMLFAIVFMLNNLLLVLENLQIRRPSAE